MYKHKTVETTSMRGRTIGMMLNTLYEKNVREEQHSRRVSELCVDIGNAMGLPEDVISKLRAIGLVHDIGKIAINDDVLNKPGKLTNEEFMEIKRHSAVGYRILNANNEMSEIAEHVLMHHERLDGSGYPNGLKDDEIPLITRILAVADSYDAMTSERTYRASMTREEATIELRKSSGTQFDAEVVQILLEKVL